jgi:hypothetical protein
MSPHVSSGAFNAFFAWAPWIIGIAIYLAFYVAKRSECAPAGPTPSSQSTFACAQCGRRGSREQMIPQDHGGAISWQCPDCTPAPSGVLT